MSESALINQCREAIGKSQPDDDWKTEFTSHSELIQDKAPKLALLLNREALQVTARQLHSADDDAMEAQRSFKSAAIKACWWTFAVACLSALLMVPGTLFPKTMAVPKTMAGDSTQNPVLSESAGLLDVCHVVIGVFSIICGCVAYYYIANLRQGGVLKRWFDRREDAEDRRLEYFNTLASYPDEQAGEEIKLLILEYVRRYLLDAQIAFYRLRAKDFQNAHRIQVSCFAICSAVGGSLTGLSGLLAVLDQRWAALAAVAVIMSGLVAAFGQIEGINQNRANSERYHKTLGRLEDIKKVQLDTVRELLAANGPEAADVLKAFTDSVATVLSGERAQWREMFDELKDTIGRLKDNLDDRTKKQNQLPETDDGNNE